MERRRIAFALAGLTALGLGVRLWFFFAFDNSFSWESEPYSKINLVYTWLALGKPYPDTNFGPLHTWLIWLVAWTFEDKVTPIRLLSVVCGAATIPVFFAAMRRPFGDRIGLAAAALFASYPLHVRASATSLAESPYTLFFLIGLAAFLIHDEREDRSFGWLGLSAAALTAGSMLRFESWLFYPVFALLALRRGFARAVGYGALLAIFPLVHMFICWKITGDPLSFGKTSARTFALYLPQMPLSYRATAWFVCFWQVLAPAVALLVPVGMVWAMLERRGGTVAALFAFPYLFMSVRTLNGLMDPALLRYAIIIAALLIPFAAAAIWAFARRISAAGAGTMSTERAGALAAVIVGLVTPANLAWAYAQSIENALPPEVFEASAYLRDHVAENERVLLDKRFHPVFVIESRKRPENMLNLDYVGDPITDWDLYAELARKFHPLAYLDGREVDWGRDIKLYNRAAYEELMARERPAWLVLDYESAGNIQALPIAPTSSEAEIDGRRFTRAWRKGDFAIFRVEYPDQPEIAP
ncbi:MAG: glycosyltransferase family 39 protein [Deltaproteobacteria bacterium]|nr:glycosyltransferase family 39 protein [Deltaproteobacteria bacterium]